MIVSQQDVALGGGGRRVPQQDVMESLWRSERETILNFARRRLEGRRCRLDDAEDVVQSALLCLWRRISEHGESVYDMARLGPLLRTIVQRKAIESRRRECRLKRGGVGLAWRSSASEQLDDVANSARSPSELVELNEACNALIEQLVDPAQRRIARMRMQGDTLPEIALALRCARSTIARKLKQIRESLYPAQVAARRSGSGEESV